MNSGVKIRIAPSLLSADFVHLASAVRMMEKAKADWLHVDVMDGHFVPNLTVGPGVVESLARHTRLPLDVHLMIERPETYLEAFAKAGAWLTTVHWEAVRGHASQVISMIKHLGLRAGISIRPKTPLEPILPYLSCLDLVLVMTVEPGFGGQKFMFPMLDKVRKLNSYLLDQKKMNRSRQKRLYIEVDGGINPQTAPEAIAAGANVLVAGHAIFRTRNPIEALQSLRRSYRSMPKVH